MSDKQPEALRLADALDRLVVDALLSQDGNTAKTSTELRRLHALCEEMGEALETIDRWLEGDGYSIDGSTRRFIRTALAKWKELNNEENHDV